MPSRRCPRAPAFEQKTSWWSAPRSQVSGSQFAWPANSSSLLFSCTGVNSFAHLALQRLSEGILPYFMEGDSIHRNFFDTAVIKLIAFPQEIRSRLRIGNNANHPAGRAHDSINHQCHDL